MGNDRRTKIKQAVTAAIISALMFFIALFTLFPSFGDKVDSVKEAAGFFEKRAAVEKIYQEDVFAFDEFINTYSLFQVLSGTHLFEDAAYEYIIMDMSGKLHFPASRDYESKYGDVVVNFAKELRDCGIPFIYIQAPNKKIEGYTVFPAGGHNYSNEDADDFLRYLNANNVDTLDLREHLSESNISYENLFYVTDHHWTTKTAFWAYTVAVQTLYENYGIECDPYGYYRDLDNYNITDYENNFLGSQGRRVGKYVAGVDDYTFIAPAFDIDYEVYDMLASPKEPVFKGGFYDCIAKSHILENPDIATNRHGAYFEYDYGCLVIKNNSVDNDIKIMLIKDSFSLPFAAFLSTCVSELHMIDLRDENTPSVSEYALENGFDAVIMMYNTEVFNDKMFSFD